MKPVLVPHSDYQVFVLKQLRTHYGPGIVLINKDWPLAVKLWMTDLSAITTFLHDAYSLRGPLPRDPASLLRSFLICLMTNPEMGLTEWINVMKRTPVYAVLPLVMERRSSLPPIPEAKAHASVARMALLIATILVFTPSPTATRAGTAPERSVFTATIST